MCTCALAKATCSLGFDRNIGLHVNTLQKLTLGCMGKTQYVIACGVACIVDAYMHCSKLFCS